MMRLRLDNLLLKVLSLALSFVLWLVIAGEKTSEIGLAVPLQLHSVPKDAEIVGDTLNTIQVRLRATPGVVGALSPNEVAAHLDLSGLSEGEHIVHLTPASVRVPFGVKVVRVSPSSLTLRLEHTVEKWVAVEPRLVGQPAPGHEVVDVVSEPPRARLVGPQSRIAPVSRVYTEPVSIENAQSTIVQNVAVGVEDPLVRIGEVMRARVTVHFRETQSHVEWNDLLVEVRGGGASLSPSHVTVVLSGPRTALDQLKPADVRPYVDLAQGTGGLATVAVALASGHVGVSVERTEPARVKVSPLRERAR